MIASLPSPCRSICHLDRDQVCDGCGRSLTEIARWHGMSDGERRAILERVQSWTPRGGVTPGRRVP